MSMCFHKFCMVLLRLQNSEPPEIFEPLKIPLSHLILVGQ